MRSMSVLNNHSHFSAIVALIMMWRDHRGGRGPELGPQFVLGLPFALLRPFNAYAEVCTFESVQGLCSHEFIETAAQRNRAMSIETRICAQFRESVDNG